jgi:AcrR family transcriptional regulator
MSDEVKVVRGPYRNGIRRRQEIIDTAARVFGQYGYTGGSLRQIADEVGVTPAALTRHFDSKEGLLAAVLADWDVQTDNRRPDLQQGLDYFYHLRETVRYHSTHRGLIELYLTLSGEASNTSHPAREFITGRYERVVRQAEGFLRDAIRDGDVLPMDDSVIEAEVRGVFALMDGTQLQWLLDPAMDVVGIFSHSLTIILERWTGHPVDWQRLDARTSVTP